MSRALKFVGFLVINVVVAVIGTAILDTGIRRAISTRSISAMLWTECILSIVFAALIGFGVWRACRNPAAKWTWVLAVIWFAFGYLIIVGHGDVFGRISNFGSGSSLGVPDVRSFFAFTVPLIRAISYSAGAYISSILYATPVAHT